MLLTLLIAPALAQETEATETEFAGTKEAPEEEADGPETLLSVELGGAYATGNTEYYTVNGLTTGSHFWSQNKLALNAGVNVGRSVVDGDGDGVLSSAERNTGLQESARKYFGELRYDRFVSDNDSFYALGGALVDRFAGYDLRTNEQVGYSRTIINSETTNLVTEIGADYAQENYIAEVEAEGIENQNILAGRLMIGFQHAFNDHVSVSEVAEVYQNLQDFEDLRLLNEAAITSKLNEIFSIKLSHQLLFDNVPVSDDYRKADQTVMTTLVASLI